VGDRATGGLGDGPSRPADDREAASAPFVSVVVPTFRRDRLLCRLLNTLLAQDLPHDRFEIVVVDDACSPSTACVIADATARCPDVDIRLLPGRGPATARNIGWRAARGEVIAFIDDDAYPADACWLREGCAPFTDPRVVGVCGTVRVPADDPPTDYQRSVKRLELGGFITCNAFYRRRTLEQVGGFDERFTAPFREDSDLHFRVEATGGRLTCNPRAAVVHPAPPGRFAVALRLQRNSVFNALIYKKHPRRYREELQRWPPFQYYAIVGAAGMALVGLLTGHRRAALAGGAVWAALDGWFFLRRARGVSHRPRHLLDLALTSVLIPPLSIYWRLRGAIRYRVLFI
jgi:glycosyltransferase involved in cell wall biosynthesis